MTITPTKSQTTIIRAKKTAKTYLEGVAGTGKTTTAVARLEEWLKGGIPPHTILILLPQITLATPYLEALRSADRAEGTDATIATFGSLTQTLIALFWALIADKAGFANPSQPPVFLSLETAQYFMGRVLDPIIERDGLFDTVKQPRNRLYSQILDNLNKSALVKFPHTDIAQRLKSAWDGGDGDPQLRVYDDVQVCAIAFRAYCYQENLLDFSLQVELLIKHLLPLPEVQAHLKKHYHYIIADNCEENSLASHQLLSALVAGAKGALVIADLLGGYRRFLGADLSLLDYVRQTCQTRVTADVLFTSPPAVHQFASELVTTIGKPDALTPLPANRAEGHVIASFRYYPQLTDAVADEVGRLVGEGVPPHEIAILAPFLTDTLRFSLMTRLEGMNIPVRSHRPSRPLSEEPAALALLHLACLAYPQWGIHPPRQDLVTTLKTAIGMDLVRAQLLVSRTVSWKGLQPVLKSFMEIPATNHPRITYGFGGRYERIRAWLELASQQPEQPLDHFWRRLFGEILSTQGYGFNVDGVPNKDMAEVASALIQSATQFRLMLTETAPLPEGVSAGAEFVRMLFGGILSDLYLPRWTQPDSAVLVAPAYTFLLRNTPVRYQFWLNIGDDGWSERVYQPLTNPYVLTANWERGRKWTAVDEEATAEDSLQRLILGLSRLCTQQLYLGISEWNEQGYEQRGLLLQTVHRTLKRWADVGE
jgi:hypothetical protein